MGGEGPRPQGLGTSEAAELPGEGGGRRLARGEGRTGTSTKNSHRDLSISKCTKFYHSDRTISMKRE